MKTMNGTNYIVLCNQYMAENIRTYTNVMVDVMESEYSFIMQCVDNNYISLEAETVTSSDIKKKTGPFKTFIDTIKKLFEKFIANLKEFFISLDSWSKNNLPKLDNISYDNLTVTCLPYYECGVDQMLNYINAMMNKFSSIEEKEGTEYPSTPDEIVKTEPAFAPYRSDSLGFTQACKHVFSYGKSVSLDKAADFKGYKLTSPNEIKDACGKMRKYLESYKSETDKLSRKAKEFTTKMEQAEREYKAAKESYEPFLILEDAYIGDTDLRYCMNYTTLFEKEVITGDEKTSQGAETVDSAGGDKNNNSGGDSNTKEKKSNKSFLKYKKDMAYLITQAIACSITVAEAAAHSYRRVISSIIAEKERQNRKTSDKSNDDNVGAEEREDTAPEKVKDKAKNAISKTKDKIRKKINK